MSDRYASEDLPDSGRCFDHLDFQILELMGKGVPDHAIGNKLSLGHRTVQRRVQRMMERTGANGRFALGIRVSELGLLPSRRPDRPRQEESTCGSY
ncbi:DNA-binding response regulator [Streptomyces sp. NPDC054855]